MTFSNVVSKLKARKSVLPRFSEKRRSSFERWASKELSTMSPHVRFAVPYHNAVVSWHGDARECCAPHLTVYYSALSWCLERRRSVACVCYSLVPRSAVHSETYVSFCSFLKCVHRSVVLYAVHIDLCVSFCSVLTCGAQWNVCIIL